MNREYNYSELIEDYLTGNLSEKQIQEFELQLQKDPDLNKELMLQKDIISAIKDVRKAELKSMLNKVNVSSTNGFNYFPIQFAGAILVSSMLAIGAYYYFSEKNQPEPESSEVISDNNVTKNELPENTESESSDQTNSLKQNPLVSEDLSKEKTTETTEASDKTVEEQTQEVISDLKNPPVEGETSTPGDQPKSSDINVETKKDTKHAFHYQYYEDKLFLYGDFKGSKYEILKIPASGTNNLFMSYNGKFYKMERSRKIKAFEPVEDPAVIQQLQKIKSN